MADLEARSAAIEHFVEVAEQCRYLKNFNSLAGLLLGLNATPIAELSRTWGEVDDNTLDTLDALVQVMDPSDGFRAYREELAAAEGPCVPFLGELASAPR